MALNIITALVLAAILELLGNIEALHDVCRHYGNFSIVPEDSIKLSVQSKAGDDGNWTTVFTALGDTGQPGEGWVVDVNHTLINIGGKDMIRISGGLKRGSMVPLPVGNTRSYEIEDVTQRQNEELINKLKETIETVNQLKNYLKEKPTIDQLKQEVRALKDQLKQEIKSFKDQLKHEIKDDNRKLNTDMSKMHISVNQLIEENAKSNEILRKILCCYRPLMFNLKAGSNIVVSSDGRRVSKINSENTGYSIAYSNRPLYEFDYFELTLTKIKGHLSPRVIFGVSFKNPNEMNNPENVYNNDERLLAYNHQGFEGDAITKLENTKVGDRFGLRITQDGYVHFYYNGKDFGTAKRQIKETEKVYGMVHLWHDALEVAIS